MPLSDPHPADDQLRHLLPPPEVCRLGGADEGALRRCILAEDAARVGRVVAAAARQRAPYTVEYRTRRRDDSVATLVECGFFTADDEEPGFATIVDVSEQRRREHELWLAAHYDPLTGLPNRRLFLRQIGAALAAVAGEGTRVPVLVLNVDRFREANEMFGREIGNRLLLLLGIRLREAMVDSGTVAHLGLDIFAVLLNGTNSEAHVSRTAQHLLDLVSSPFTIDERAYYVTASIGIGLGPVHAVEPNALLGCAYTATVAAKAAGRNDFRWFSQEKPTPTAGDGRRRNELLAALDRKEFVLHYQPIVDLASDRVVAVEALVRWDHPTRGCVQPDEFIEFADRSGLIVPLGEWVLREACRQLRQWCDRGFDLRVCVNVSAVQFREPRFIARVASIVSEHGIAPERLELELTESVMVDGITEMIDRLLRLKALGLRLAIDDFGTGYSSLAYLKHFPVDTLKIDRAFIIDIATNTFDRAIATTVLTLAKHLDRDCVVEGIETADQLDAVSALGATLMQGYYFSRPIAPEQLTALLVTATKSSTRDPATNRVELVAEQPLNG